MVKLFKLWHSANKEYDCVFVLPGLAFQPIGGYFVVFKLAEFCAKDHKVAIVFIDQIYKRLCYKTKDNLLCNKAEKVSFKMNIFFTLLKKLGLRRTIRMLYSMNAIKILKLKIHESMLSFYLNKEIDMYFNNDIPNIKAERIFATSWQTAYFVKDFQNSKYKYYLIQGYEGDKSYSGEFQNLAKYTYSFDLKKIVISYALLQRFMKDNPIKIIVSPHLKGEVKIKPENRENIILVQLREGEEKGAIYGIEACRLIKKQRNDVRIIAYGNYRGDIPSFVEHKGVVSDIELIELFNLASVFIFPSIFEGFGLPVVEAMSCGCVPIAFDTEGPNEIIKNGYNGLLISLKDVKALADAVLHLIDNKEERIKMAYNAIESSKNYTDEEMFRLFKEGISSDEKSITKNYK